MTKNRSLLTHMDACVDTGGIHGTKPCIDTGDTGLYLVRTNNIISKASLYEDTKTKLLGAI